MTDPSNHFKASASFAVHPVRSQVVLVGLTVTAIFALLVGGSLLAMDKASGWPFVVIATLLCASIVWCWRQSHRDTDLAQAHPTKLVRSDGANLSTDSRLLTTPEGVRAVAQMLDALVLHHPLPEPSGLVGPGAVPIPNSKAQAVKLVDRINADNQISHNQRISFLHGQLTPTSVTQEPDDGRSLPSDATRDIGTLNALIGAVPPPYSSGNNSP